MFSKKLINFLFYFIFVSIGFFFSPYLHSKGLDYITIGYLQTAGLTLMLALYFLYGLLADYFKSNKVIIILNLILTIFSFSTLILSENKLLLSIAYILSYGCFMVLVPILDGFVLQSVPSSKYSNIRAWGSFGAGVSFFFNNFFLSNISYNFIIIIDIIFILIIINILFATKEKYISKEKINYLSSFKESIHNKDILIIFILAFLTYGTLKADDAYAVTFNMDYVMLTSLIYGIFGALAIFFEAFVMRFNTYLQQFKKSNLLMLASFTLFFIYFSRAFLFNHALIILIGNVLIGLFIGLFIPVAITTINNSAKENQRNTFLSLYQISISLGGIVLGFLTTTLLSYTDVLPNIYFLHTIIIFISILLIISLKKKIDNSK